MISNLEFVMLVTRTLFIGERELFEKEDSKKMVSILQSLISYGSLDIEKFLVKDGIVMFFLHVMFEKRLPYQVRKDITKLLRSTIDNVKPVVGAFMPIQFVTQMAPSKQEQSEDEMIEIFLRNLDAQEYANQFLMWNNDLKEQQHYKIKMECERIMKMLSQCEDFENNDCKLPNEAFIK